MQIKCFNGTLRETMEEKKKSRSRTYKCKCQRCRELFRGRFGQKYCSARCRAGEWYSLRKSKAKDYYKRTEDIKEKKEVEVNEKGCPFCKGTLYTPAAQPEIIKCSNIYKGCPGLWKIPNR
jgi:hypothetical protein